MSTPDSNLETLATQTEGKNSATNGRAPQSRNQAMQRNREPTGVFILSVAGICCNL